MIVRVRGVELSYDTAGAGPPYVLVHGGPGMGHPDRIGPYRSLADRVQLVAYEHRGHGARRALRSRRTRSRTRRRTCTR